MLTGLRVRNLAVVESAGFEPGGGLNVISGETGAGKSILIGAIELLFGGRGDADRIRSGADTARVEGQFHFDEKDFFRRRGVDLDLPDGSLLLVREIQKNGRSKALVNDEMVTVSRLKAIGEAMADLHGQHEHQRLLRPETHVDYLDRFGATLPAKEKGGLSPLEAWRTGRERWLDLDRRLAALTTRGGGVEERRAALVADIAEIETAALQPGEEADLRAERLRMLHAEKLLTAVSGALDDLEEGEAAIESRLGQAARRLVQAAALDPGLQPVRQQIESALVELQEAGRELARYRDRLQFEPDQAEWIDERLILIGRLKKKHGGDEAAILARGEALRAELDGLADEGRLRQALEQEAGRAAAELVAAGGALREWRLGVAQRLVKGVGLELAALGMKEARLHVRMEPVDDPAGLPVGDRRLQPGERGFERIEFFLEANPGEEPRPLARVASGGELSRVMLALKAVLRMVDPLPILLFDEVDAGIGGRVASEVGLRLREISKGRQVHVITHLAMIAAQADRHFRVEKEIARGRTVTTVQELTGRAREEELARMLAGDGGGDEARRTARALLDEARKGAR